MTTELERRTTIGEMVRVYNEGEAAITEAHRLLKHSQEELSRVFYEQKYSFMLLTFCDKLNYPQEMIKRLKQDAWRQFVNRMEIRQFLSVKANEELDRRLSGDDIPDITEEAMWAMLQGAIQNIDSLIQEAVKEVYDILRPRGNKYKTNTQYALGKRVILASYVEERYSGNGFTVEFAYAQQLRAIDKVFHVLDGITVFPGYDHPLRVAIERLGNGEGQTEYFAFRCCKNRNLHLEFLRPDLVQKLNEIAGAGLLKDSS